MNADVKKEWLEALRSGEFEQGKGALMDGSGRYCCLGVLCELHRRKVGGEWEPRVGGGFEYLDRHAMLPTAVSAWAGLGSMNPVVGKKPWRSGLAELNDSGEPFDVIANRIEAEL